MQQKAPNVFHEEGVAQQSDSSVAASETLQIAPLTGRLALHGQATLHTEGPPGARSSPAGAPAAAAAAPTDAAGAVRAAAGAMTAVWEGPALQRRGAWCPAEHGTAHELHTVQAEGVNRNPNSQVQLLTRPLCCGRRPQ